MLPIAGADTPLMDGTWWIIYRRRHLIRDRLVFVSFAYARVTAVLLGYVVTNRGR